MLGTPEDLLEMTDLGIALTAAPEAAGSEMFPVRPSLWEQYMHSTALHFCLKERKKKKKTRESDPSCLLRAALCSSHLQSLTFKRTLISQTAVPANERKNMIYKKEMLPVLLC